MKYDSMKHQNNKRQAFFVTRVKFNKNGKTRYYNSNKLNLRVGDKCMVEGEKGIELGVVSMAKRNISAMKMKKPFKKILRKATQEDLTRIQKNRDLEKEVLAYCEQKMKEGGLSMKLSKVELDFHAEKGTFYFSAEGRVDFRELVKDLAQHFKIKIEMWQIGVRDEARMLGGCGICGKSLCCSSFLCDFEPVSIRMAKDQNLSLTPMKISGICGRLMCCLVYEHKNYCSFKKNAPRVGRVINTPEGKGRIAIVDMMLERVTVELEDGKKVHVKIKDIPVQNRPANKGCKELGNK